MAGFVTAASRLIDAEMGRWDGFFYPTSDSSIMYYDGTDEREQPIDEFVSISEVAVSEQGNIAASTDYTVWTLTTDYLTKPYNATAKAKPINCLVVADFNGSKGAFYCFQKSIRVTGILGYSATPPDIIALAARMQSVRYFMRAKQGYQDTGTQADMGSLTIKGKLELDPDIKALLYPIKLELSNG